MAGAQPGEVVIVGAGDPTLAANANMYYPGSGRLDLLAEQVKRALGAVKPTKVIIDDSAYAGSAMGPGWQKNDVQSTYLTQVYALSTDGGRIVTLRKKSDQRYANPARSAGEIFARYLGLPTSAVSFGTAPSGAAHGTGPATPGSVLGSVQSAPLERILDTMLSISDNMVAEAMARQVAIATGRQASFAGAATAVTEEITNLGLPMAGVHILDGSGISHQNRLTPALLAAAIVLAAKPDHPELHALFTGLPVAGYSGSLRPRFKHRGTTSALGMLRAKTGTLVGVYALAGYVIDVSGRPLVFVALLDKAPWEGAPAALDKIGAALRNCGCGSPPN